MDLLRPNLPSMYISINYCIQKLLGNCSLIPGEEHAPGAICPPVKKGGSDLHSTLPAQLTALCASRIQAETTMFGRVLKSSPPGDTLIPS